MQYHLGSANVGHHALGIRALAFLFGAPSGLLQRLTDPLAFDVPYFMKRPLELCSDSTKSGSY